MQCLFFLSITENIISRYRRIMNTGDRPQSCGTCGKSFTPKRNLKTHICLFTLEIDHIAAKHVENHSHGKAISTGIC